MVSNEGKEILRGIGLLAEHIICAADSYCEVADKRKVIIDISETAARVKKEVKHTRLIHYERTAFPNKAYGADQMKIDPCVDVISRMYTSLESLDIQGKMTDDRRPYFLAEYR